MLTNPDEGCFGAVILLQIKSAKRQGRVSKAIELARAEPIGKRSNQIMAMIAVGESVRTRGNQHTHA